MKILYFVFSFVCAALSMSVFNPLERYNNITTVRYHDGTFSKLRLLYDDTNIKEFFFNSLRHIYTSKSEILDLVLPSYLLTYKDEISHDTKPVLFIIESNGSSDNTISVYNGRNVTKLIEGNDVAPTATGENIYIATNNGIHIYKDNKTERYGTLSDKFINIELLNNTDLYALNEDRKLYKILNNGTKKVIVNEVIDAEKITSDLSENIYYYNNRYEVFVYNNKGVRKVEGLPNNIRNIILHKAVHQNESVIVIINNGEYCDIKCNATCTAKCDPPTGLQITALGVTALENWFVAVGNAVYEFDLFIEFIQELQTMAANKPIQSQS